MPLIYAVLHRASQIANGNNKFIWLVITQSIELDSFHLAFNLCLHSVEVRFYPIGLHIFHESTAAKAAAAS